MKKIITILFMCLCLVDTFAQKTAYISIKQRNYDTPNDTTLYFVKEVGQFPYNMATEQSVVIAEFGEDGQVHVTDADGTLLAKAPVSYNLAVYSDAAVELSFYETQNNYGTVTIGPYGYGTFISPYHTVIPSNSDYTYYLPSITETGKTTALLKQTMIPSGTILKPYTAILVKGKKNSTTTIPFPTASNWASKVSPLTSEFNGAAVRLYTTQIENANKLYVLTFGREKDTKRFGFFRYMGECLNAGKAFLTKKMTFPYNYITR